MYRRRVEDGDLPWACLMVWGFADSPVRKSTRILLLPPVLEHARECCKWLQVSWQEAEHGWGGGGENDYAFLLLPHKAYWRFR